MSRSHQSEGNCKRGGHRLDHRTRKCFGYITPYEVFFSKTPVAIRIQSRKKPESRADIGVTGFYPAREMAQVASEFDRRRSAFGENYFIS